MKKLLKIIGYLLLPLVVPAIGVFAYYSIKWNRTSNANMKLLGNEAPVLTINGYQFRDLNKNGKLDIYEDSRADTESRVADQTGQMNLEEKAGLLFITMTSISPDGSLSEKPNLSDPFTFFLETNSSLVAKKKMNHFNLIQAPSALTLATWNNTIQKLAERTRLGIPVTIATDPRHGAGNNPGASIPTPFFSHWCSPVGFAAIGDTVIMKE